MGKPVYVRYMAVRDLRRQVPFGVLECVQVMDFGKEEVLHRIQINSFH